VDAAGSLTFLACKSGVAVRGHKISRPAQNRSSRSNKALSIGSQGNNGRGNAEEVPTENVPAMPTISFSVAGAQCELRPGESRGTHSCSDQLLPSNERVLYVTNYTGAIWIRGNTDSMAPMVDMSDPAPPNVLPTNDAAPTAMDPVVQSLGSSSVVADLGPKPDVDSGPAAPPLVAPPALPHVVRTTSDVPRTKNITWKVGGKRGVSVDEAETVVRHVDSNAQHDHLSIEDRDLLRPENPLPQPHGDAPVIPVLPYSVTGFGSTSAASDTSLPPLVSSNVERASDEDLESQVAGQPSSTPPDTRGAGNAARLMLTPIEEQYDEDDDLSPTVARVGQSTIDHVTRRRPRRSRRSSLVPSHPLSAVVETVMEQAVAPVTAAQPTRVPPPLAAVSVPPQPPLAEPEAPGVATAPWWLLPPLVETVTEEDDEEEESVVAPVTAAQPTPPPSNEVSALPQPPLAEPEATRVATAPWWLLPPLVETVTEEDDDETEVSAPPQPPLAEPSPRAGHQPTQEAQLPEGQTLSPDPDMALQLGERQRDEDYKLLTERPEPLGRDCVKLPKKCPKALYEKFNNNTTRVANKLINDVITATIEEFLNHSDESVRRSICQRVVGQQKKEKDQFFFEPVKQNNEWKWRQLSAEEAAEYVKVKFKNRRAGN
jgi:hypothetical protein